LFYFTSPAFLAGVSVSVDVSVEQRMEPFTYPGFLTDVSRWVFVCGTENGTVYLKPYPLPISATLASGDSPLGMGLSGMHLASCMICIFTNNVCMRFMCDSNAFCLRITNDTLPSGCCGY
jgi:hypothetical protein